MVSTTETKKRKIHSIKIAMYDRADHAGVLEVDERMVGLFLEITVTLAKDSDETLI